MYRGLKIAAIIAAAGKGSRMKTSVNKQYIILKNKPVLAHTLEVFENSELVDNIVVVTGEKEVEYCRRNVVEKYGCKKISSIIFGGDTRQQSVNRGLTEVDCDIVVVHDGARPFLCNELIENGIKLLLEGEYHGTVCAVPVKDTIKLVGDEEMVNRTLDRKHLRAVQTPQCFYYSVLCEVQQRALKDGIKSTDDSMLLEHYGYNVKLYPGSYINIKITTPEDMLLAKILLEGGKYNV